MERFTALGAKVSRFWQLLVCRSLVGVGEAGYGPAAQALLAEFFLGKRRALPSDLLRWMAFWRVLGNLARRRGSPSRYGWRAAFVALGVPASARAARVRLREPAPGPPPTISAPP